MKKKARKLILSKETIRQMVPKELGEIARGGQVVGGCTSPYRTAYDCSGGHTWTGESDPQVPGWPSDGCASVYCTLMQM